MEDLIAKMPVTKTKPLALKKSGCANKSTLHIANVSRTI